MNSKEFKEKYKFFDSFTVKVGNSYSDKEFEYMKLCFVFRLYWIGPMREHAPGLLRYYEQVWPKISQHVKLWQSASMKRPRKVNKDTGDILVQWLSDASNAPPMMCFMDINNRSYACEAADIRFDFKGRDYRNGGSIELSLPVEWVESNPQAYSDWFAELAQTFEFCSGFAGYGLDFNDLVSEVGAVAKRQLYSLGRHHPGLDVRSDFSDHLGQGIKGVNWLTFLHPTFVERLGGREKLEVALNQLGIGLKDLANGIMIQAGDIPEIGDTNRLKTCPYYHVVGKVLAPIRDRNYPQLMMDDNGFLGSRERTEEWLSRFD